MVYLHFPNNVHNGQDDNEIRKTDSNVSIRQQFQFTGFHLGKEIKKNIDN